MYADSPTRQRYPLDTKKITKKVLTASIALIILVVIVEIIAVSVLLVAQASGNFNAFPLILLILIGGVSLTGIYTLLQYLYQRAYFNRYYYNLDDHFIVIRKGVFFPLEINIPYERVQDIYVDQDLMDRVLGIYDVHLSSATVSSGMHAHIDGVAKEASVGLRDELLNNIHQKISKK